MYIQYKLPNIFNETIKQIDKQIFKYLISFLLIVEFSI